MNRLLASAVLLLTVGANCWAGERITAKEAVQLAEQFIADQGYTGQVPKLDKIKPESFERPTEGLEATLKLRANSLNSKALGVLAYNLRPRQGESREGWTVAFQWKSAQILYPVRIVTMGVDGSGLIMQHGMAPVGIFLRHH